MHPYEIKRRLTNAMVECFTDVDVGTLYYAVRQLSRSGLIESTRRQKVRRGGVRTIYRITTAGRARFQGLLREQWLAPGAVADTLYIPLLFLHLIDAQSVQDLLDAKVARQQIACRELLEVRKRFAPQLGTGGNHLLKHLHAQRRLDLRWLKELRAEITERGIRDLTKLPAAPNN